MTDNTAGNNPAAGDSGSSYSGSGNAVPADSGYVGTHSADVAQQGSASETQPWQAPQQQAAGSYGHPSDAQPGGSAQPANQPSGEQAPYYGSPGVDYAQYQQATYAPAYGTGYAPPGLGQSLDPSTKPNEHLALSIIALVASLMCSGFLGIPFAIAGLVFSTKVESKFTFGDVDGARDASKKAWIFSLVALVATVVTWLGFVGFAILFLMVGAQ